MIMKNKILSVFFALTMLFSLSANSATCNRGGGEGSSSCSASGTYTFMGITYEYSVSTTCREGYYACCNFHGTYATADCHRERKAEITDL